MTWRIAPIIVNTLSNFILQLASQGFTNLDALDGSSVMLEQAAKTGVYGKCIQELFGAQDSKVLNGM